MTEIAVLGQGCFWCTEAIFSRLKGVVSVTSGYAGGTAINPTYYDVSSGKTGHAEVLKIEFDPTIISYQTLLEVFFHTHDPTTPNQQGADIGSQYRSIILYVTEEQKEIAEQTSKRIEQSKLYPNPIVTEIKPLVDFYSAEDYHRKYYEENKDKPYCQFVISPKLAKFKERYQTLLK